jgi:hypothetical protein
MGPIRLPFRGPIQNASLPILDVTPSGTADDLMVCVAVVFDRMGTGAMVRLLVPELPSGTQEKKFYSTNPAMAVTAPLTTDGIRLTDVTTDDTGVILISISK